ncbi:MAG: heme biosynthesis HemY N-terminal domain-containing protein [Parvularculaceae bacterium]|nr:heme biosynthesis HemY N-terminal domain-containing protein [Parvularculaceae bacterium]
MLRLLIFIFFAALIALGVVALLTLGETVKVEAFGWKIDAPPGLAAVTIAAILGATALLAGLWKDFVHLRRRGVLRGVLKRREKGVDILLEAVRARADANSERAAKLAAKAARLLDRDAIASLFALEEPAPVPVSPKNDPPPASDPPTEKIAPPPESLLPPVSEESADESLDRDVDAARRVN